MKKTYLFSFLILITASNILSQSGWFWQNPLPQGNPITKCSIIDNNTVVAVGGTNTIIKSTDGGNSWLNYTQQLPNNCSNQCVFFLNNQTGWIGGQDISGPGNYLITKVFKTINGGENWNQASSIDAYSISKIQFLNSHTGYLLAGYPDGVLMKSTNGGLNWFLSDCFYGPSIKQDFSFINENTGWLIYSAPTTYQNNNIIYKTSNGGVNWVSYNPGFVRPNLTSIHFLNSLTGWLSADSNLVFRSTDGGISWSAISTGSDYSVIRIKFTDEFNGIGLGRKSSIYSDSTAVLKTTDSGLNWNIYQMPKSDLWSTSFFNTNGWTFQGNKILKST